MKNKNGLRILSVAAMALACAVWSLAGCSSPDSSFGGDKQSPAAAQAALDSLSLVLGSGANLISEFSAEKPGYFYDHGTAGGETMTVSAEADAAVNIVIFINDHQEDVGEARAEAAFKAPVEGTSALTIRITAEKSGMDAGEYTITVTPRQKAALDDYNLSQLTVGYTEGALSLLTPSFSQGQTSYEALAYGSDGANKGSVFVKAAAASSEASVEIFDGDGTRLSSSKGSASGAVNLPSLDESKQVIVQVTQGDGKGSLQYKIMLNHVSATYTWTGTVRYDGTDRKVNGIEVYDAAKRQKSAAKIDFESDVTGQGIFTYTFDMNQKYTPKYFVVNLVETGKTDEENPQKYASGYLEPLVGSQTKPIGELFVDGTKLGNRIANVYEFLEYLGKGGSGSSENYTLANDIDLAAYRNESGAEVVWVGPAKYKGTLFGNNKTIKGLVLKKGTSVDIGLFTSVNGATLQDFTLEATTDPYYEDNPIQQVYFGGVVGRTTSGSPKLTLKNITVNGDFVVNEVKSYINFGGLVGVAETDVDIDRCVSNINVRVKTDNGGDGSAGRDSFGIGGFIGTLVGGKVTITNSYATGSYDVTKTKNRHYSVGGFIGWTYDSNSKTTTIDRSYFSGNVRINNMGRTDWTSNASPAYLYSVNAGGFIGNQNEKATSYTDVVTITNSAVVSDYILALTPDANSSDYSKSGRLVGRLANTEKITASFTNNIARIDMLTGHKAEPATRPSDIGDSNGAAGKGLSLNELKQKSTWTGNLGWSEEIWDFSDLSQGIWPTLKQK